jgi:hypothetical protein
MRWLSFHLRENERCFSNQGLLERFGSSREVEAIFVVNGDISGGVLQELGQFTTTESVVNGRA